MDDRRFIDYFVVTGLPPPGEWQTYRSDVVGQHDPVVDIVVINRTLGEVSPPGYSCVEFTVSGLSANLNHGSLRASEMFVCYQRGRNKPPIVDIRFDCFENFFAVIMLCGAEWLSLLMLVPRVTWATHSR